jgi:hypothetical protein
MLKESLFEKVNQLLSADGEATITEVKLEKILQRLETELKCIDVTDQDVSLKSMVRYK